MSDPSPVSTDVFRAAVVDLKDYIREHVDRITERQDVANGRTNKLEASQAATHERLTGIDREIRDIKRMPLARVQTPDGSDGVLNLTVSRSMAAWIRGGLLLAGAGIYQLVMWLLQISGHS